jgi:hypothetical protein
MGLEVSEDLAVEANHTLSLEVKKKVMGENAARLYDIDITKQCARAGPAGHRRARGARRRRRGGLKRMAEGNTERPERLAQVRAALDAVTDPEIDESVTSLKFISRLSVEGDQVSIEFRLPTYWCAPNFAALPAQAGRGAAQRGL